MFALSGEAMLVIVCRPWLPHCRDCTYGDTVIASTVPIGRSGPVPRHRAFKVVTDTRVRLARAFVAAERIDGARMVAVQRKSVLGLSRRVIVAVSGATDTTTRSMVPVFVQKGITSGASPRTTTGTRVNTLARRTTAKVFILGLHMLV
jgi:hypothetical protein